MRHKDSSLKDYYAVLGVPHDAGGAAIRDAFRKMAKRYHPDVASAGADYSDRFREINEAYDILGNPNSKKEYDLDRASMGDPRWHNFRETGKRSQERPQEAEPVRSTPADVPKNEWFDGNEEESWEQPAEKKGIFDKVFGYKRSDEGTSSTRRREEPDSRFGDLETEVLVTLAEVLRGASRVINLRRKGSSDAPRQFTVEVPRGVRPGHVIRLKGKGRTSLSRGTTGDLFVSVRYAAHPEFRIDGFDLFHSIVLRPWQFVLGDVVSVPTIEGGLQTKIPKGSIPGQRLKIREQGLPKNDGSRGDLVLTLKIELPQELSSSERQAWEQLRDSDRRTR